jgi:hypothetical protein
MGKGACVCLLLGYGQGSLRVTVARLWAREPARMAHFWRSDERMSGWAASERYAIRHFSLLVSSNRHQIARDVAKQLVSTQFAFQILCHCAYVVTA